MARTWTKAQEAAMTLSGKTLLVSAAAGSGKTSVLTERIIRSLTAKNSTADLSKMLIVTFTRAAASELKSRISAALSEALAEDPENTHLSQQLFLLGSAQISTIDSFFQRTVREHFEQIDIPSSFRIADENELEVLSSEILGEIIEDFYTKYTPSSAQASVLSIIRSNRFALALNHLLTNRSDGKLIPLLLEFYKLFSKDPMGIDRLKSIAVRLRADADLPFLQTLYGKALKDTYLPQIREDLEIFEDYHRLLSSDPAAERLCSGLICAESDHLRSLISAFMEDDIRALIDRLLAFPKITFPTIKEKSSTVLEFQTWRKEIFKKRLDAIKKDLGEFDPLLSEKILRTAELCEMLHLLFQTYEERFLKEKKARGILEYNDVRGMLYRMLTLEDGSPSPFAKSLAAQYEAVYIDEYQDVDEMQDRIFAAIGEDRRFMVGDIKQSIYGFRGSEPSIFASYRRAFPLYTEPNAAQADGLCVFMSENFRCDQPIIDFTNEVCAFLFSASEESVGYRPEDDLCGSKSHDAPLPEGHSVPVQVCVFPALPRGKKNDLDDEDAEVERSAEKPEAIWVANEITRLLAEGTLDSGNRIRPRDIVILVRSKSHGQSILRQLKKKNIPAVCEVSKNPLHEPIMIDLINLLRVIDNPYRDLPLSEFLLSPLCGFTPDELHTLREGLPSKHALFDALEYGAAHAEEVLAKKTSQLLEWLEKERKLAAVHPADRFLHLLSLDERMRDFTGVPAFRFLHEQARVYQRSSWCGLYGFLQHVTKLLEKDKIKSADASAEKEAVTIMTIHHSKGLEFPVVFLYNSASAFNKDDLKKSLVYHKDIGFASLLYNEESGIQEDNLLRTAIKRKLEQDSVEENVRTLYVALTRARERLYVTGTLSGGAELAQIQAKSIRYGKRMSILKAPSYLIWILAALNRQGMHAGGYHAMIRYFSLDEMTALQTSANALPLPEEQTASTPQGTPSVDTMSSRYADVLRAREGYEYPLSVLQGLPTKIAASYLRPNLLDEAMGEEGNERAIEAQLEWMTKTPPLFDALLEERRKPKATDIGTATHAFLEFCDFARLSSEGIDAECERLLEQKFISPSTASLLNRAQLELFLKSDLMRWLLDAKEYQRELTFGLFFPFSDFTRDPSRFAQLEEQNIFVQGSIDLFITLQNGKRILIDYKTDRLTDAQLANDDLLAQKMLADHGSQLQCYARAIKELFGAFPDEIRIYSLPAGRTVPIVFPKATESKNLRK